MLAVVLADFVDRDDIRVIESGGRFGFRVKSLYQGGRGQLAGENHFERDRPIKANLPRAVDHAHPTAVDFLDQFIVAEVTDRSITRACTFAFKL